MVPLHLPDFLGREREIAHCSELLERPGLITIAGTGGMGKTTLALAALALLDEDAILGRCFLAQCANGVAVQSALAAALDTELGTQSANQHLASVLRERGRGILLLDNAEHVSDAVAELVAELLEVAPQASILVTSREVLRLTGEQVLELGSLAQDMSRALFLRTARPGHSFPDAEHVLDQLLQRLDGIPLALKIVAGRSHLMPPQQLLEHLDQHGLELSTRTRGTPERHRSMEAAIRWSWDLIGADEKHVLQQLAVFRVLPDVADLMTFLVVPDHTSPLAVLEALRDSSMLLADMRLASLIRDYVWTQTPLEQRHIIQRRHAEWCLERVREERRLHDSRGPRVTALRRSPGVDDLQAAAVASAETAPARALALLEPALEVALWFGPFTRYADLLGIVPVASLPEPVHRARRIHLEIRGQIFLHEHRPDTVHEGLALAPPDSEERVLLLMNASSLPSADADQRVAWAEEAESLAAKVAPHLQCHTWLSLQYAEKARANNEGALRWFDQIVAANPADKGLLLDAHVDAAGCLFKLDRDASGVLHTAQRLSEQGGTRRERAGVTMQLGAMYVRNRQHALARPLLREAMEHYRILGSSMNMAGCLANLGYIALIDGDLDDAEEHFQRVDQTLPPESAATRAINRGHRAIVAAARRDWTTADQLFSESTNAMAPGHAAGFRAMHGVVLARLGRTDDAEEALQTAQTTIEPSISGGVQVCAAMARGLPLPEVEIPGLFGQLIARFVATAGAPVLRIHEAAGWVELRGARVPLKKRSGPWALLLALARDRDRRFDNEQMFAAGWPGQRIAGSAATHRVHVALSTLRKLGLGAAVDRNDDGYAVPEHFVIEWLE